MREQPKNRKQLQHILEAIDTIQGRCDEMTRENLTADKVLFGEAYNYNKENAYTIMLTSPPETLLYCS